MAEPKRSDNQVRIGPQGRVVIPAVLRKALNLKPGDQLVIHREGDRLVLERRETIIKRLQERFRHIPKEISLVDELIAERREEARREGTEETR